MWALLAGTQSHQVPEMSARDPEPPPVRLGSHSKEHGRAQDRGLLRERSRPAALQPHSLPRNSEGKVGGTSLHPQDDILGE